MNKIKINVDFDMQKAFGLFQQPYERLHVCDLLWSSISMVFFIIKYIINVEFDIFIVLCYESITSKNAKQLVLQ